MSYETALQWALDHVPPQDYDSFNDWYRAVENKMNTPNLMSNPVFNRMLENAWRDITGTDSEDRVIQRIPSREQSVNIPRSQKEIQTLPKPSLLYSQIITRDQAPAEVQSQSPIIITTYHIPDENRRLPPTGNAPVIYQPPNKITLVGRFLDSLSKVLFGRR